ncbi:hypothetical protein G4B88_003559 [Cannabis sativa]|uniref:RING-type domain-containing protein n=1 Tax=Cannabis sativa TaxID=3483 RepID=A0A7J6EPD8_CANSA|nr:hypothetical protein G4B88_003559 [Cannabis sativa]
MSSGDDQKTEKTFSKFYCHHCKRTIYFDSSHSQPRCFYCNNHGSSDDQIGNTIVQESSSPINTIVQESSSSNTIVQESSSLNPLVFLWGYILLLIFIQYCLILGHGSSNKQEEESSTSAIDYEELTETCQSRNEVVPKEDDEDDYDKEYEAFLLNELGYYFYESHDETLRAMKASEDMLLNSNSNTCVVCLEKFTLGDQILELPCGRHLCHRLCALPSNDCPGCWYELPPWNDKNVFAGTDDDDEDDHDYDEEYEAFLQSQSSSK